MLDEDDDFSRKMAEARRNAEQKRGFDEDSDSDEDESATGGYDSDSCAKGVVPDKTMVDEEGFTLPSAFTMTVAAPGTCAKQISAASVHPDSSLLGADVMSQWSKNQFQYLMDKNKATAPPLLHCLSHHCQWFQQYCLRIPRAMHHR
jgi:hypothetical protein